FDSMRLDPAPTPPPSSRPAMPLIVQPPQAPAAPGEYTRLFGPPAAPEASPPLSSLPNIGAPPAPTAFDWGASNGASGPSSGDSYFERLTGGPAGNAPAPAAFGNFNNPLPAQPASSVGPSEFTRIISGQSPIATFRAGGPRPAPPAAAPAAPASVPASAKPPGDRVLLYSLIGVVIVALIFVVVFVLAT
ncbi:MAG: hypothetical protein ACREMU_05340, partial [Gemmatimonadaceae bacterium]